MPIRTTSRAPDSEGAARDDEVPPHPLTTRSSPLLPSRHVEGGMPDVWEELDRAAAWVCDHLGGGVPCTDEVRHALRVLCIAVRAAALGGELPRSSDLSWGTDATGLLGALRRRLLEQAVSPAGAAPADVLRLLHGIDRLEAMLRRDDARVLVAQLSGARALELLVEMAHDMRSPLGSILFLVERLRADEGALTSAQERQLGLVYGAAFGLSTMVGDVMELARGGDRLATGEPAPLFLGEVFEGVREIVQPIAEERGLTLESGPAPSEARVGHAAAIQRVLLNLVTNALKFTPHGTVSVSATARDRSRVAFAVQDTGPGIPPRVVAQLFDAFRPRGEGGREFAFSSAGLGLAICRKLVGAMGGELAVETTLGRGTCFRFELELPPA